MSKKIIEVNYGLASSYSDFLEINYKLRSNPELRKQILEHEKRHSDKSYNKEDFKNDFQSKNSYSLKSLWFSLTQPKCLVGFMPFMYNYYKKDWTFNSSALFPFIYFGIIFCAFWSVLFKINFLYAFICFTAIVTILNILLIIIAHIRVKKNKGFIYQEIFD